MAVGRSTVSWTQHESDPKTLNKVPLWEREGQAFNRDLIRNCSCKTRCLLKLYREKNPHSDYPNVLVVVVVLLLYSTVNI